jgi:hypothetical protein
MNRKISILLFAFIGILVLGKVAQAGFGISPPYVKTAKPIFPGSHYEQKITLLRSSAEESLRAQITVNAPDIAAWISIDKGDSFELPAGELQVPMIVRVDVPGDAELGNYKGNINVRIAPQAAGGGGVSIALGARIDVDLTIDNQSYVDFIVRTISIPDFETLKRPWSWPIFSYFFHRIQVLVKLENTGNVEAAPTRVHLEVYDSGEKKMLESGDDKTLNKIKPYATDNVIASFRTKLGPGQYWGKVKVYKDNEIVKNDKMIFTIYAPGKSPTGAPKLGAWPYLMMAGLILLILLVIAILIKLKSWRVVWKLIIIISWPFVFIGRKLIVLKNKFKIKFWQWIHKKSSQYQNFQDKDKNGKG